MNTFFRFVVFLLILPLAVPAFAIAFLVGSVWMGLRSGFAAPHVVMEKVE